MANVTITGGIWVQPQVRATCAKRAEKERSRIYGQSPKSGITVWPAMRAAPPTME